MADANIDSALDRSTHRFVAEVASMSDSQWRFRPSEGAWSASEVTEHLEIANRGVLSRLGNGLTTPIVGPLGVSDDEIPYLFYRAEEPPNISKPTGTWSDINAAVTALTASTDALIQWHTDTDTDTDLRAHGASHPIFGTLDALQWLLFAQAHLERHRAQLIGLRMRPDFPKDTHST
jgi:hypothetical protein